MTAPGQTWLYFAAGALEGEAKVFVVATTLTRIATSKKLRIIVIRFNSFSGF